MSLMYFLPLLYFFVAYEIKTQPTYAMISEKLNIFSLKHLFVCFVNVIFCYVQQQDALKIIITVLQALSYHTLFSFPLSVHKAHARLMKACSIN